ncbi:hypothetical protein PACTADRAFT_50460 [Pachysolen tannophilus NRRL Y-2460]|uniref:Protein kinase domain-containing protein n=1 Tax=Pachysolen tannophilus NRRL Y-2460 TaxID=669874 RepID=A0A1E4TS41_PACTA|nr:hypothetical protein PACTADRAFT_50460 [Pachysolen tannophilus NRRL Y-2460]
MSLSHSSYGSNNVPILVRNDQNKYDGGNDELSSDDDASFKPPALSSYAMSLLNELNNKQISKGEEPESKITNNNKRYSSFATTTTTNTENTHLTTMSNNNNYTTPYTNVNTEKCDKEENIEDIMDISPAAKQQHQVRFHVETEEENDNKNGKWVAVHSSSSGGGDRLSTPLSAKHNNVLFSERNDAVKNSSRASRRFARASLGAPKRVSKKESVDNHINSYLNNQNLESLNPDKNQTSDLNGKTFITPIRSSSQKISCVSNEFFKNDSSISTMDRLNEIMSEIGEIKKEIELSAERNEDFQFRKLELEKRKSLIMQYNDGIDDDFEKDLLAQIQEEIGTIERKQYEENKTLKDLIRTEIELQQKKEKYLYQLEFERNNEKSYERGQEEIHKSNNEEREKLRVQKLETQEEIAKIKLEREKLKIERKELERLRLEKEEKELELQEQVKIRHEISNKENLQDGFHHGTPAISSSKVRSALGAVSPNEENKKDSILESSTYKPPVPNRYLNGIKPQSSDQIQRPGIITYQESHYPHHQTSTSRNPFITVNGISYERLELIGRGGSSKVYKVKSSKNSKLYAVKRVTFDQFDESAVRGFKGEIDLLMKLRDKERIVKLNDYSMCEGALYLVMECGDIDLAHVLSNRLNMPLDIEFVKYHSRELLRCVADVHNAGVVHFDLKPANFLFVKGILKIIDFGIANVLSDHTVNIYRESQIGTPNYMSPESLLEVNHSLSDLNNDKNHNNGSGTWKVGKPSDIWSCGCIIYQMIYGRPPYAGYSGNQRLLAIMNPQVKILFPDTGLGGVQVPKTAIEAIKNCLQRDPAKRWTINEVLNSQFLKPRVVSKDFVKDLVVNAINFGVDNGPVSKECLRSLTNDVWKKIEELNL